MPEPRCEWYGGGARQVEELHRIRPIFVGFRPLDNPHPNCRPVNTVTSLSSGPALPHPANVGRLTSGGHRSAKQWSRVSGNAEGSMLHDSREGEAPAEPTPAQQELRPPNSDCRPRNLEVLSFEFCIGVCFEFRASDFGFPRGACRRIRLGDLAQ